MVKESQKHCNFILKFEGPALSDNTMDVNQLAPSLLSFSDALASLNNLVNESNSKVSLQIRALNKGSFVVDFLLSQDIMGQIGELLSGKGVFEYCTAYTLVRSVIDLISLKKWLTGKKPDRVEILKDRKTVIFYLDDRTYTTNNIVLTAYRDYEVNRFVSQAFSPLKEDGIDAIHVGTGDKDVSVEKSDADVVFNSPEERILTSSVNKCVVTLETAAFKDNAKWKVQIGEKTSVFVSISDPDFMRAVNTGEERFGKGDVLLVNLETKQTLTPGGKIQLSYDIKKVLDHQRSPEQLKLFS